jgi:excisionase family DNA binding protein
MITLGNAAKQLGLSKPTISKAISRGHLSATRRDDGSFAIDPAELMRWWEGAKHRFHSQPVSRLQPSTSSGESGTADGNTVDNQKDGNPADGQGNPVLVQLARLEAELSGARELIRVHRDQIDDLRGERDKLLSQVEAAHRLLTHQQAQQPSVPLVKRRPWWRRLTG